MKIWIPILAVLFAGASLIVGVASDVAAERPAMASCPALLRP